MDTDFLFGLLPLILLFLFVVFPIYVLAKLAWHSREIRELKLSISSARPRELSEAVEDTSRAGQPSRLGEGPPVQHPPQPVLFQPPTFIVEELPDVRPAPSPAGPADVAPARYRPPILVSPNVSLPVMTQVPARASQSKPFDIESVVGANWLAKLGVAAIVLAVAFFLQYAFSQGLISPTARVAIGLVGAAVMIGIGEYLIVKEQYRNWAQVVISGGIVVYFLSIWAAYNLYHLVGYTAAFGAFAAAAVTASFLAVLNNSQSVAVICVLGAFLAPVLIRSGAGATDFAGLMRLYTYLVALNVWVLGMMRLRPWHGLAGVAFIGSWSLFFLAGKIHGTGWLTEGFAALFLLFALITGVRLMRSSAQKTGAGALGVLDLTQSGVGLILGGCIAFCAASAVALAGLGMLGVPDLMLAGVLAALVLAGLAAALPPLPRDDQSVRRGFAYLAAATLSLVLLGSISSAEATRIEEVPLALGFAAVNYLLFLGTATVLRRRPESEAPAAVLIGVNAIIHTIMVAHILANTRIWSFPAASMWLPLAGLVTLAWMGLTCRRDESYPFYRSSLIGAAAALPVCAFIASLAANMQHLSEPILLFAVEFLVISGAWLASREIVARAPFRADLGVAFVNAAAFFGLMVQATGTRQLEGISLLAMASIGMGAYHAVVGGTSLLGRQGDKLSRLVYLGLALTFVTIAIPLQLKASYITVAWAVEAAVLVWTASAISERRLQRYGLALMALAAAKAFFFDLTAKLDFPMLFLNTRMLAGASVIVAAAFGAWVLAHGRDRSAEENAASTGLTVLANAFTLIWVSVDLWDFVGHIWSGAARAQAQQLTLSLFWTVYALVVVCAGIGLRVRPVRLFGMGLLYLCIVKVFLLDLAGLEQPYRILSFLTLGIILLLVSLLYTRFEQRLGERPGEKAVEPRPGTQTEVTTPGGETDEWRQKRAS